MILIIWTRINRSKSWSIVGTIMRTEEWWRLEVMKLPTLMEPRQQSTEEDRPSNIIAFCKGRFNSQGIDTTIQMTQIVRRPLTTHEYKIIWVIKMGIILEEKTRAQLNIIRRRLRRIQGCLKTFKKTWILRKSRAFHKFSSNRLLIYSNLSPFSLILAVEN